NRPKGSPAMDFKVIELTNVSPLAKGIEDAANKSVQRSIYLPLMRTIVPKSLEVFDFADQGLVTGSRDTTTVATQALYLLNDPFVRRQSLNLAAHLLQRSEMDDAERINRAYRLTIGRPATAQEIARAKQYLGEYEAAAREVAAATPAPAAQSEPP